MTRPSPTSADVPTRSTVPTGSTVPTVTAGVLAVIAGGAIFGFFYAWVCSTMWGLDQADPRVAIAAMQEMNASVRNAVFFPAFFLTPAVMLLAAALAHRRGAGRASALFALGAVVYLVGGLLLTMTVNVPMNEELARVAVPASRTEAATIWADYSGRWKAFNLVRTGFSGLALTAAAGGLWSLGRHSSGGPETTEAGPERPRTTQVEAASPSRNAATRPPRLGRW